MGSRDTAVQWRRNTALLLVGLVLSFAGVSALATPTAQAATVGEQRVAQCKTPFFGLVPWYQYMGGQLKGGTGPDRCDIKCFNLVDQGSNPKKPCGDTKSHVPEVLLAIIDDLLRVAAIVTLGFVIYGAFQYVGSQGDPEGTGRAQKTIINALVGLALAMTAVAIVTFIGKRLGG